MQQSNIKFYRRNTTNREQTKKPISEIKIQENITEENETKRT